MIGVLLVLGAAGASASAILQVVEVAVSALQTGDVTSTQQQSRNTSSSSAQSGSVEDTGYSGQTATASV